MDYIYKEKKMQHNFQSRIDFY